MCKSCTEWPGVCRDDFGRSHAGSKVRVVRPAADVKRFNQAMIRPVVGIRVGNHRAGKNPIMRLDSPETKACCSGEYLTFPVSRDVFERPDEVQSNSLSTSYSVHVRVFDSCRSESNPV